MKISFTQKEYRLLAELIFIARRVMTSYPTQKIDEAYFVLCRKLHALYQDMGAENFIEHDEEHDVYSESEKFKTRLHKKYIQPYNDETFKRQLLFDLTTRDLAEKSGDSVLREMNEKDQMREIKKISDKYEHEFSKNGLNNLRIIGSAANDDLL